MSKDFSQAENTIILSDIHLAEAEPPKPGNPLWKRFKRSKYFVDKTFFRFIEDIEKKTDSSIELILNGDIFDFDSVMVKPDRPSFPISWLEHLRGLNAVEEKSEFKIKIILDDHPIFMKALRSFVMKGNRLIFIIGNHDMEVHWEKVRSQIINCLDLPEDKKELVRFCEWFYISNQDTLIEHGNQYDSYCLCQDPVHPLIKKGNKYYVRVPFGNMAGKYMLNGMGMMNPHVDASFIKSSFNEYVVFFYKYVIRYEPFLLFKWFWSAIATGVLSIAEGVLPALKDPLTIEHRVKGVAQKANTSTEVVRSLRALHVHPAIFNPVRILQELWLDRALLFFLIVFASFQFFTFLNVFVKVSMWWFFVPVMILMPVFIFYAKSVQSEIHKIERNLVRNGPMVGKLAKVSRVIMGHTHREFHTHIGDIEFVNTGTWSPAFEDPECLKRYGRTCFAWLKPGPNGNRTCSLYEWRDPGYALIEPEIYKFGAKKSSLA